VIDVFARLGRLCVFLLLVAAWCGLPVSAHEVTFPDPALQLAVQQALNLEGQPVDSEDLEDLTTLLAGAKGIVDLTGLESCSGLEQLHLYQNQIVNLEPLAGLESLKAISLSGNRIVDIGPLAMLVNLTSLAIHGNQIADVAPIASLPLLATLSIGNLVDDITPLADLPSLVQIKVYVRPTVDLAPLSRMRNLTYLFLSTGQPMSGRAVFDPDVLESSEHLTTLHLHGYDIAHIADLADAAPTLTELVLQDVGVDDLSAFRMFGKITALTLNWLAPSSGSGGVDLTRLELPPSVTSLVLEGNELDDVTAIAAFTSLTSLGLSRNQIADVEPLKNLGKLLVLDLSFNPIADLSPLLDLSALRSVTLQGVPFDRTEGSEANDLIRELLERGVNVTH